LQKDKYMHESESARAFVAKLVDEKLPNGLDEEVKQQLISDLLSSLETQLNATVLGMLNDKQTAKLEHLIDTNQLDKIQGFLAGEGVNMQAVVAQVMAEFQASYIGA
jgi:hypothetical protein